MNRASVLTLSILLVSAIALPACSSDDDDDSDSTDTATTTDTADDTTDATGSSETTASISQGPATTTVDNLFDAGVRIAGVGASTALDDSTWVVPADVNYTEDSVPFASDMHNIYGNVYDTAENAVAALDGTDVVTVDEAGDIITAYVFADNYFEMYVNGVAVGKDAVPFTDFNSHIVRFQAERPFTVAMHLVDWEENLGLGSENNQGSTYHPGDGGMVAVFEDASGSIIGTTGSEWKAQTFYTAPLKDTECLIESDSVRDSSSCDIEGSDDGTAYYAYHWSIDSDWASEDYDDSSWPEAVTYTNDVIGVDNKSSYTNFTSIFDSADDDAEFIWSSNVVLDNSVLVRYTFD